MTLISTKTKKSKKLKESTDDKPMQSVSVSLVDQEASSNEVKDNSGKDLSHIMQPLKSIVPKGVEESKLYQHRDRKRVARKKSEMSNDGNPKSN